MSFEYDRYLERHRASVSRGLSWIASNLPKLLPNDGTNYEWQFLLHDKSKIDVEEYEAYDKYFYGNNRSFAVVQEFNRAWLHHIHCNPHHWQHWVLINDDPDEGEICIEMPDNYILEMICDWWSFSWSKGNAEEIFDWYEEHRDYIKLHKNTRKKVEDILDLIGEKLSEGSAELMHHGVKGQKWGVRRTPEQLGHPSRNIALENPNKSAIIKGKPRTESGVAKQKSAALKKGIRSLQARIDEHKLKISDPLRYCEDWETFDDAHKAGLIRHWEREIITFQRSIDTRIEELKKRGDSDE